MFLFELKKCFTYIYIRLDSEKGDVLVFELLCHMQKDDFPCLCRFLCWLGEVARWWKVCHVMTSARSTWMFKTLTLSMVLNLCFGVYILNLSTSSFFFSLIINYHCDKWSIDVCFFPPSLNPKHPSGTGAQLQPYQPVSGVSLRCCILMSPDRLNKRLLTLTSGLIYPF